MALTACRECSAQVSTAAKTCPSCGVTYPDAKEASRAGTRTWIVAAIYLVGGLALAFLLVDILSSVLVG